MKRVHGRWFPLDVAAVPTHICRMSDDAQAEQATIREAMAALARRRWSRATDAERAAQGRAMTRGRLRKARRRKHPTNHKRRKASE